MAKFFIDRPIFAWVIALFIMVMGAVSITQLPISQYPPVAPPSIVVNATYPGASAKTLEDSVLSVIEQEMNGSPGLIYMESVAQANGTGSITLSFQPGTNADLAQVSGINTKLVVRVTWVIAGSLAAMAGTMLALDVQLKPDLAFNIVLPIFAAAIVGGLGQSYGAIAGGFLIGFAETLAIFNWSTLLRPLQNALPFDLPNNLAIVPTEYKLTVAFVILVVVLLWRPTGIFKGASS